MTAATLSAAIRPHSPELADWLDSLPERPDRVRAWPLIGRLPPRHLRGSAFWPVATLQARIFSRQKQEFVTMSAAPAAPQQPSLFG